MHVKKWALALGLFPPGQGQAKELLREFRSAYTLAAGDTGLSSVQNTDAIFYNPSGIAQVPSLVNEFVLASPQVTLSDQSASLYNSIKSNKNPLELLQQYNNTPIHAGIQNFTGVAFRKAAFGLLQKAETNASAGNDPKLGLRARASAVGRVGAYFAVARSFLSDSLFLGATFKVVQKAQADFDLGPLDAEKMKGVGAKTLLNNALKRGTAAGADFGMTWKATDARIKPAIAVVGRNVGMYYDLGSSDKSRQPEKEPTVLDVGLSCEPGTKHSFSRLSLDLRDVTNVQKEIVFKRLHAGAEVSFEGILGVMAGMNQGYPTYGGFIALKIFKIEAGSYSEEMGDNPGDMRSRRYFGRVSVGWVR